MIRILTDSASDLTATDSARPGVYTVPLSVTFADGTGGLDCVELTADEFYAHLKVDKVPPRTSQPSPVRSSRTHCARCSRSPSARLRAARARRRPAC